MVRHSNPFDKPLFADTAHVWSFSSMESELKRKQNVQNKSLKTERLVKLSWIMTNLSMERFKVLTCLASECLLKNDLLQTLQ